MNMHGHIYVYTYMCVCMYIRIHYTDKIYAMKSIRKAHVVKNNKVRHTLAERNIMQVRARSLSLSRTRTHTHTHTERGGGREGDRDRNMLYGHKHTRSHHNTCVAECWHRRCGISTLQHTTCRGRTCIDNNTLLNIAAHFNTLQHTTTHCKTLQHTTTHCNSLKALQPCWCETPSYVHTITYSRTSTCTHTNVHRMHTHTHTYMCPNTLFLTHTPSKHLLYSLSVCLFLFLTSIVC